MVSATIVLLETDIEARANNARADLYAALKAWAEYNDHNELMNVLDCNYLTVDRLGNYPHPITGNGQKGMVIAIDKPARDAAMAKAGRYAGVPADVSNLYNELLTDPTRDRLMTSRLVLRRVWEEMTGAEEDLPLTNVINF